MRLKPLLHILAGNGRFMPGSVLTSSSSGLFLTNIVFSASLLSNPTSGETMHSHPIFINVGRASQTVPPALDNYGSNMLFSGIASNLNCSELNYVMS